MKIIFINSKKENCGVYQYGLRLWENIKYSNIDIKYYEIEDLSEFMSLDFENVDILFFNFIQAGPQGPLGWYNNDIVNYVKSSLKIKTVTIKHTDSSYSIPFDFYLDQNPSNGIPRPIYNYDITKERQVNEIPNICSFGFAFDNKGFSDVVRKVNEQYDKASINLHITNAHYGDENGSIQRRIIDNIMNIKLNEGVKLNITTNFMSNTDILNFTRNNDIVILGYTSGNGISSLPDFPISTNTPIGVTNINMFRHIYDSNIDIDLHTIPKILEFNKSSRYIESLNKKWSQKSLNNFLEIYMNNIWKQ